MKIGYPCINRTLTCQANKTFRLKSYSETRFTETVENNLDCLQQILRFNRDHNLLFFRISSDIIPFASHPILSIDWVDRFKISFADIGRFIKTNNMRISMHPDQFIVLNSKKQQVVDRSIKELGYHADLLDAMKLDATAKIQLHVGGVYGEKNESMNRFINHFEDVSSSVKKRLVIENDDRNYCAQDCLTIAQKCHIPVLFDVFHHMINNNDDESVLGMLDQIKTTWDPNDGIPMLDYSSQQVDERTGKHTDHIDINDFNQFLKETSSVDFDVMLEIKDKEKSALQAVTTARSDPRFVTILQ